MSKFIQNKMQRIIILNTSENPTLLAFQWLLTEISFLSIKIVKLVTYKTFSSMIKWGLVKWSLEFKDIFKLVY